MTDVNASTDAVDDRAELGRLKLSELHALAAERGIVGVAKLRKGELVDTLSGTSAENTPAESNDSAPDTGDTVPVRRASRRHSGQRVRSSASMQVARKAGSSSIVALRPLTWCCRWRRAAAWLYATVTRPLAMASMMTLPKVSVVLGKMKTSAEAKCTAKSSPVRMPAK